jgi:hypothetical protein
MKQIAVVFRVFLLTAVLASLAACSGGTFVDPGHEAAGGIGGSGGDYGDYGDDGDDGDYGSGSSSGGGGGGSKPAKLSSNASYAQAVAKLDAIISYCNAYPGTINNQIKTVAQQAKTEFPTYQSSWSAIGTQVVSAINVLIDQLE